MRKINIVLLITLLTLLSLTSAHAQAVTRCEAGFRLFEDDLLATDPICIPEQPQRIAAVDTFTLETLLAMGIKPVSGPFLQTFLRDHPQFTSMLDGVIDTDWPANPEALLKANPDLIISIEPWIKDLPEIVKVAPTVSIKYPGDGNWQDIVHAVGSAINQSEKLDAAFSTYDARLKTFQDWLASASVGEVSIVFLLPDQLQPFLGDTFSGSILPEAGLKYPEKLVEATKDGTLTDISKERLDLLNTSDHIFVVTSGFTDEDLAAYKQLIATLEADPLWQSLPAAKAGHVHIVGRDWIGSSLIAANGVLDDLFTDVAGVDPVSVSPNPFLAKDLEATPEATASS